MLWPLLDVIDACAGEPWCARSGRTWVGDGASRTGPVVGCATARHLAGLFDSYGAHRPAMLAAWAGTATTGSTSPADLRWQAELWRRLRARVGTPSPAERLDAGLPRLRADPELADLPDRLSLFGPTRLTTDQLERARRAGRAPRRPPVAAAPLACALGAGRCRPGRGSPDAA